MVSLGMFASRAARSAVRSRALCSGSPPPLRAATVTSRMSLVKRTPLVAPIASFLRLIFVHLLWPDMLHTPSPLLLPPDAPPKTAVASSTAGRLDLAGVLETRYGGRPGVPPSGPHLQVAVDRMGADSSRCRLWFTAQPKLPPG